MSTRYPAFLRAVVIALAAASAPAPAAQASQEPKPALHVPSITDTMAQVGRIADELKEIERRLQHIDKSVAGIEQSLVPVAQTLRRDSIRETTDYAARVIHERAVSLILLGTACLAALIVLHALLRRRLGSSPAGRNAP